MLGPLLPPHQGLVLVKQEPEEGEQLPGVPSMSEPAPTGGTTGEGTAGGQAKPTPGGVSVPLFY